MRRRRIAALTVAMTAALAANAQAAEHAVTVGGSGDRFSPSAITITAGDTVKWTWGSGGHNVHGTSGPEGFESPYGNRGATWSKSFSTPGTYTYVCDPHDDEMRGTITVNPAATPQPQPEPQPEPQPQPGTDPQPGTGTGTGTGDGGGTTGAGSSSTTATAGGASTPSAQAAALVARGVPVVTALRASVRRSVARVALRLSEDATVVVGLRRLGAGRRVVRTRRIATRAGARRLRVSMRGLPAGRYRVRVVALDAEGNRSPARTVRVRLRR